MTNPILCSIIIPVLNESKTLSTQLALLQHLREAGHEIIVIDGGSQDDSANIATPYVDQLISSECGRAKQMNKGAACAKHNYLLFLHIDTTLPEQVLQSLQKAFSNTSSRWGRFDVRLSGQHILYRCIEWLMNKRSRITGIVTGDQAMFVSQQMFKEVGGFPDIPLMEDITLSRSLKKISAPICLSDIVISSSRRWQEHGIVRTIFFMWSLRLAYFFGVSPAVLAKRYYQTSK